MRLGHNMSKMEQIKPCKEEKIFRQIKIEWVLNAHFVYNHSIIEHRCIQTIDHENNIFYISLIDIRQIKYGYSVLQSCLIKINCYT